MSVAEQRDRARARANEVRLYRAHLKEDVRAGRVDAATVISSGDPRVASMLVVDVLRAVRRVGPTKAREMLLAAGVGRRTFSVRVGELTDRERRVLLAALELRRNGSDRG